MPFCVVNAISVYTCVKDNAIGYYCIDERWSMLTMVTALNWTKCTEESA